MKFKIGQLFLRIVEGRYSYQFTLIEYDRINKKFVVNTDVAHAILGHRSLDWLEDMFKTGQIILINGIESQFNKWLSE